MSFQGLHIMPENEWDEFYSQLKEPLPVVFRITGYKRYFIFVKQYFCI